MTSICISIVCAIEVLIASFRMMTECVECVMIMVVSEVGQNHSTNMAWERIENNYERRGNELWRPSTQAATDSINHSCLGEHCSLALVNIA